MNRDRDSNSSVAMEPTPCDGCEHLKRCSSSYEACNAFEAYSDGQPIREWRFAARIPLRNIGRRMLERAHGSAVAEAFMPKDRDSFKTFVPKILAAGDDESELSSIACRMEACGYHLQDIARVMQRDVAEVRELLRYRATA